MNFDIPYILNEEPLTISYGNGLKGKIGYKIAVKVWKRTRAAEAQNWKCCYCGCDCVETPLKKNSATLEHVIPESQGGTLDMNNVVMACYKCNNKRAAMNIDVFMNRKKSTVNTIQPKKLLKDKVLAALKEGNNFFNSNSKEYAMYIRYKESKYYEKLVA